ncbi:iron dependent repressor, metal binding and dimerization domain protein [Pseudactinotalea sp. Z1739]|uniref:metal-dependent transcriptional regulator n=1 Tax=Pseudactinotalea sp. Z1739 TaxID=3413028 RepID=UPI003C7DF874
MSDLIDTTEMYLKTVFELIEDGVVPLRARIAERLGHSGPTVSQTVARMERDGLMVVSGDRHLELTDEGLRRATQVMRKHRLAERLLTDVIKLDWPYVHEEACRWEHVMSERVEQQLLELLERPREDPYGNTIPGPAEIGQPVAGVAELPGTSLSTAVTADPAHYTLVRIGEPLQVDVELLTEFERVGLVPGVGFRAQTDGAAVDLTVNGQSLELTEDTVGHLFVSAAEPG